MAAPRRRKTSTRRAKSSVAPPEAPKRATAAKRGGTKGRGNQARVKKQATQEVARDDAGTPPARLTAVFEDVGVPPSAELSALLRLAAWLVGQKAKRDPLLTSTSLLFAAYLRGRSAGGETAEGRLFAMLSDSPEFEALSKDYFDGPIEPPKDEAELPPVERDMSDNARRTLVAAAARAAERSASAVETRDLLVCLLTSPENRAVKRLAESGVDAGALARRIDAAEPEPRETPGPRIGGRAYYWSDRTEGDDLLGIRDDVAALSDVLAAREVRPPMAVGLFGDWGSGKTFFMKQLENRIAEIEKRFADVEETAYCRRIVPVHFNAWQYVDGNLWANLVARIFERLSEELVAGPGAEAEELRKRRRQLFDKLALAREELEVAERELARANERKSAAETRRTLLARTRDAIDARLGAVRPEDVAATALRSAPVREALERVRRELGPQAAASVQELRSLHDDISTGLGQLRRGGRAIAARWGDRERRTRLVLQGAALIAASGLASWGLAVAIQGAWWVAASAAPPVLGALTPLLVYGRRLRPMVVGAYRTYVSAMEEEARRQSQRAAADEREKTRLETDLARADAEVREREAAVAAAQAEVDEIAAGTRLKEFIRDRSASDQYRRHLGIVATIREDFRRLSGLLEAVASEHGARPIERVVLYIDDLDRCPAERVVEVLQAVHLLLDFELFVAVVAVDSRWLMGALRQHYREFASWDEDDGTGIGWMATPQSYLEKIFQIPFTLRPMGAAGYANLVRALIPEPEARAHAPHETPAEPTAERAEVANTEPGPDPESAPEEAAHAGTPPPKTEEPAGTGRGNADDSTAEPHAAAPPEPMEANPERLQITPGERGFIERLAPLLPTPRTAKRLVNLYWLIRASLRESEIDEFVGSAEHPGSHRIALFLLAILVGYPRHASGLFQLLLPGDGRFLDCLAYLQPELREEPDSDREGRTERYRNAVDTDIAPPERGEWLRMVRQVNEAFLALELPAEAAAYAPYVPRVARYSFHSGRVVSRLARGAEVVVASACGAARGPHATPEGVAK